MSGKQHKREVKREKMAVREAARRRERQRTIQTFIVILVAVAIGGVIIFLSLGDPDADVALDEASEGASEQPSGSEAPSAGASASPSASASAQPTAGAAGLEGVEPCAAPGPPANANKPKNTYPDGPTPQIREGRGYIARIDTTCGPIVVELAPNDAPETVNSFVFLTRQGFFNGLEIFRNEPSITILQTGAGDNTASWDIGYELPDELGRAEALGYPVGTVAMANAGPGTSGSQFFIVYGDAFTLDPTFTNFGRVIEGYDTIRSIGAIPNEPGTDTPTTSAYINSIVIEDVPESPAAGEPIEPREEIPSG